MIHEVTGCEDCPASYLKIDGENYGCELKRGLEIDLLEDGCPITPENCPLKSNDITLKLKQ